MRGTALIAHLKAGGTQDPLTTMRHVRDGDTIRLNDGTVVKVAAIERGTVAYIYTGHGLEMRSALDAPVTIDPPLSRPARVRPSSATSTPTPSTRPRRPTTTTPWSVPDDHPRP
jgi:hypothetical protein